MSYAIIASPDSQVWWLLQRAPRAVGEVRLWPSEREGLGAAPGKELLGFGRPLEDWLL